MQGDLIGTRYTKPITIPEVVLPFARDYYLPFFRAMRGEVTLQATGSAQQGLMPTMHFLPQARIHFLDLQRGLWAGGGFGRTFDGEVWRTTLLGDLGLWARRGATVLSLSARPQQLQNGDLLADLAASIDRTLGKVSLSTNYGYRIGQSNRVEVGWVSVAATFPINERLLATATVGNYPTDLLQQLPGAKFLALSIRLPTRTRFQRRDDPVIARPQPNDPTDGIVLRLAAVDSSRLVQVVRVRAPASDRVELMADFTEWEPVSLVRTPAGLWEITLPITPGLHRLNVRLDGGDWVVPTNLARVTDEFGSTVGQLLVR